MLIPPREHLYFSHFLIYATLRSSQIDRKEYDIKVTKANTNQKVNTIWRPCLTDCHTVFTSQVFFDFMFKVLSSVFKHCESSFQKDRRNILSQLEIDYLVALIVYLPDKRRWWRYTKPQLACDSSFYQVIYPFNCGNYLKMLLLMLTVSIVEFLLFGNIIKKSKVKVTKNFDLYMYVLL